MFVWLLSRFKINVFTLYLYSVTFVTVTSITVPLVKLPICYLMNSYIHFLLMHNAIVWMETSIATSPMIFFIICSKFTVNISTKLTVSHSCEQKAYRVQKENNLMHGRDYHKLNQWRKLLTSCPKKGMIQEWKIELRLMYKAYLDWVCSRKLKCLRWERFGNKKRSLVLRTHYSVSGK